jgi:mRNA interferase HigB
MRVFSKSTLVDFYLKHNDCKDQLLTWYKVTTKANWTNFNDVKRYFNSVDCIKDSLLIFNIKGNSYRLVVNFNFKAQWAFVKFIGTYADYDKMKF